MKKKKKRLTGKGKKEDSKPQRKIINVRPIDGLEKKKKER